MAKKAKPKKGKQKKGGRRKAASKKAPARKKSARPAAAKTAARAAPAAPKVAGVKIGGELPDFLPDTRHIREQGWKVASLPKDLLDRRVEITGPVDRKMVINALNSGAEVYMADFEDACSPSWENLIDGQINLKDRWAGKIDFIDPQTKKSYKLGDKLAVLLVRPRGWHLLEDHVTIDGASISGALFDFGLYFFH